MPAVTLENTLSREAVGGAAFIRLSSEGRVPSSHWAGAGALPTLRTAVQGTASLHTAHHLLNCGVERSASAHSLGAEVSSPVLLPREL